MKTQLVVVVAGAVAALAGSPALAQITTPPLQIQEHVLENGFHHPARRRPPDAPGGRQPVGPGRLDGGAGGTARHHALPRARHPSRDHHLRHQRSGRRAAHPPGDPRHGAGAHRGAQPRAESTPGAGRLLRRDRLAGHARDTRPSGTGSTNLEDRDNEYRDFWTSYNFYMQHGGYVRHTDPVPASTEQDYMEMNMALPKEHLELFFRLEADRLVNAILRGWEAQRFTVLEQILGGKSNPQTRFNEAIDGVTAQVHPVYVPDGGHVRDFGNFTRAAMYGGSTTTTSCPTTRRWCWLAT